MRKINLTILISFLFIVFSSAQSNECQLTVHLKGLDSEEGNLLVALYDSSDTWLRSNFKGRMSKITNGEATVVFDSIPYGVYAISSFHDENSNDKLDSGLFGIPKEPYASSRGAKNMFGPPKWKDAKFELDSSTKTEIVKF